MKPEINCFGYTKDGKPHPIESEIVKYTFEKNIEYTENPPEFLVHEVIEIYKEKYNEDLSYDDAKKKVSCQRIKEIICDEINEKWKDYFESLKEEQKMKDIIYNPSDDTVNELIKACQGENSIFVARNNRLYIRDAVNSQTSVKQNENSEDELES